MGQILHKRAKTTHEVRRELINSTLTIKELAKKYSITESTVKKWQKRATVEDLPMGNGRSNSVLTKEQDEIIKNFRRKTWLPLDDIFNHLKPVIPKLTRSNLHRCLKYYNISKVPEDFNQKKLVKKNNKFKSYEIGFIHIDLTEFYLEKKKCYLFVSIDRVSKMCYAKVYQRKTIEKSLLFLKETIAFFPYKIHRILTDNGQQFTYRALAKHLQPKKKRHPFTEMCLKNDIKHKTTSFYSPQTNGQVERMNQTIKESTLKYFHYDKIEEFISSMNAFLNFYNCSKKLNALKRKAPYDFVLEKWKQNPKIFIKNPNHHCVGLNI